MKTVALIPIRAGSKGISNKNMKEMCGKPLCHWVIGAAIGAKSVDEVWVSTDYENYFTEGLYNAYDGINLLHRPDWLATDTASSDDVLRHFCWQVCEPEDRVVMLQATSPLTTSGNIDGAVRMMGKTSYCVVSVVEWKRLFWAANGPSYSPMHRPMRNAIIPWNGENWSI